MDQLIQLLIYIVIFAVIGYALYWVCIKFSLPAPVLWIVGAILLIVILLFAARTFGGGANMSLFPHR